MPIHPYSFDERVPLELHDDEWAGKLRSALLSKDEVAEDLIRVLAERAAVAGQVAEVLSLWEKALVQHPERALLIAQALPHMLAHAQPADRERIAIQFGKTLAHAQVLDDTRETGGAHVSRLAHALLATDMAVPSARREIVSIVRANRGIVAADDATWPFLAPLA